MSRGAAKQPMDAMELIGIIGFSFFFAWMFLAFYWLPVSLFEDMPDDQRDFMQLFTFVGLAIGYAGLHFLGRSKMRLRHPLAFAVESILGLLFPAVAIVHVFVAAMPSAAISVACFFTGVGGAAVVVRWLDVSGRVRVVNCSRFAPLSMVGGGLLFVIASLLTPLLQAVFTALYALASTGLLFFICARGSGVVFSPAEQGAAAGAEEAGGSDGSPLQFAREIEPSFVAFGVVFGFTFVYLCNFGPSSLFPALLCVIPGAAIMAVLAFVGIRVGITILQRVLLCITVFACIAVPFAPDLLQLVFSCLVIMSWAALTVTNYSLLVQILVHAGASELYRLIPFRLVPSALGFALGWGISSTLTYFDDSSAFLFMVARLVMAVVLVVIVMMFLPESGHHTEEKAAAVVQSQGASESELFDARCEAIAKLYQLSPRETDILKYLARGRNAAHIQNKLTISPHTVKSHIYSIYRKLDIHSQQKVMDFVESFPLDKK